MKTVLFLYTESEGDKAEDLKDYLQIRLRTLADLLNVTDILALKQSFRRQLHYNDCVVLVGSRQASSFIQNKQQETVDNCITFDGKTIHEEFAENKELLNKLVIAFFRERTKNDWIPNGLDGNRIFHLQDENIEEGPLLYQLEYCIRRVLGETVLDW